MFEHLAGRSWVKCCRALATQLPGVRIEVFRPRSTCPRSFELPLVLSSMKEIERIPGICLVE
jgi:hypothetical protein